MIACVFPGQGAQYVGMGKSLYEQSSEARRLFEQANEIVGFRITDIMFEGTDEQLKMTKVTQPAVFIHSVVEFMMSEIRRPDMVAGHSLGEISALVACQCLSFEAALRLVMQRAVAMQHACEQTPSTMLAVLKFDVAKIEEICRSITDDIVVAANYNCPEQVAISGTVEGVDKAVELLKKEGARRMLPLNVGGAFHSPLMKMAQDDLSEAIFQTEFHPPICPIYQNCSATGTTDIAVIRDNLLNQLTNPVLWTQSVRAMAADGADEFVEFGPGSVLQGLVRRIVPDVVVRSGNAEQE